MFKAKRKKYEKVVDADNTDGDDLDLELNENIAVRVKIPDDKVRELTFKASDNLGSLKAAIEGETGIEASKQRLIFFGKMLLDDNKTLSDIGIKNQDFVHLMPIPKHLQPSRMTVAEANMEDAVNPGFGTDYINTLSQEEYFELVELNLWRARVRLLSSLMLFYYFLQSMGNLSLWLHPQEMNMRFTENHHPSNLFFTTDLIESIIGIMAAISGMKAANSEHAMHSAMFLRGVLETCFLHFIVFAIYSYEIVQGTIQMNPKFSPHHHGSIPKEVERETMLLGVVFSLLVNVFVWYSVVSVSYRFHLAITQNFSEEANTEEEEDEIDEVV